jgi:hypothetical protein
MLATVQISNEYIEKKNTDPLACHHFFDLCYALIDRLSVCLMSNKEKKIVLQSQVLFDLNISLRFFSSRVSSNMSPNSQLEQEKRVRREIANSNERRRMQSINTGFQSLKILIPHSCGEKLSKVCYFFFLNGN